MLAIIGFTRLHYECTKFENVERKMESKKLKFSTNEPMSETSHLRPWKALTLLGKGTGNHTKPKKKAQAPKRHTVND
jgi:hypothetical protein